MQRLLAFFFAAALLWTPAWSQSAPDALVPDLSQYILTPPAPPTPRINGAKVFGARPGSEFLFAIPASGDRPMTFAAEGLPKGLSLDPSTGFITGRVKKPGTYLVKLTARNALGEATRELRIVIGERIALTPPMGWNSWNCWARDVTQEQVLSSARAMVESGLVNHGWTYINIDDGWQGRRGGRYNAIQTNDKFPDMKELSEQVHAMGLKLGIYSSPWIGTYAAHIGSYSDNPTARTSGSRMATTTRISATRNPAATTGRTARRCTATAPTPSSRPTHASGPTGRSTTSNTIGIPTISTT